MVGVATTNKCNTCRSKKIKCDEQKPRCGQCRRGARVCQWSRGSTTFLNRSATDFGSSPRKDNTGSKNSISRPIISKNQCSTRLCPEANLEPVHSVSLICNGRKILPRASSKARRSRRVASIQNIPPVPLQFLSWSHDEILADFLSHSLPADATQEVPLSWLRSLVPMDKEVDALPLAMSALAIGWAGHADGEPRLVDKGLQLYNAAVRQLRTDIQGHAPLQVLATTAIFTLYELCEFGSESSHGWLCHMSGIASTLRLLGPEMVAGEPYLQIYSFIRVIYMIQGIRQRRKACAAALMWRTIPFARSAKNHFHKFLDLSLQVTGLLEEVESLRISAEPPRARRTRETLCRLIEHVQKLKKWEEDARVSLPYGPPEATRPSNRASFRGYPSKIPKDVSVTFDSVQNARLMRLYWTVLLTLYMAILDSYALRCELEALQNTLGLDDLDGDNDCAAQLLTVASIQKEGRQLADKISTYSEFCCQNLWQSFGSLVSTFTLETAVRWYQRHHHRHHHSQVTSGTESPVTHNPDLEYCQALLGTFTAQPSDRQVVEDYQNATFGDMDVLRLPWCDRRIPPHYLSSRDLETASYLEQHPQGFAYVESGSVAS